MAKCEECVKMCEMYAFDESAYISDNDISENKDDLDTKEIKNISEIKNDLDTKEIKNTSEIKDDLDTKETKGDSDAKEIKSTSETKENKNASEIKDDLQFKQEEYLKNTNSINEIKIKYVDKSVLKEMLEKCTSEYKKVLTALSIYIGKMICDEDHPENHCIKYVDKRYNVLNIIVKKQDGKKVLEKADLDGICYIASPRIFACVKAKLKECLVYYKKDEDFMDLYEDTIDDFKSYLTEEFVRKALKLSIKLNILSNKKMKY